jgi:small subunit ribosomal protein S8e
MVEWHTKSKRKASGGKRHTIRAATKKKAHMGGKSADTKAANDEKAENRVKTGRGNTKKVRLISTKFANFYDSSSKKTVKAEIIGVKENTANRLYARSNIATKGSIIQVKVSGKEVDAIVTNRPGQDGVINVKAA